MCPKAHAICVQQRKPVAAVVHEVSWEQGHEAGPKLG